MGTGSLYWLPGEFYQSYQDQDSLCWGQVNVSKVFWVILRHTSFWEFWLKLISYATCLLSALWGQSGSKTALANTWFAWYLPCTQHSQSSHHCINQGSGKNSSQNVEDRILAAHKSALLGLLLSTFEFSSQCSPLFTNLCNGQNA